MDKKELAELFEGIVTQIATENGLDEKIARAFVGTALQLSRQAFVDVVKIPRLQIATPEAA